MIETSQEKDVQIMFNLDKFTNNAAKVNQTGGGMKKIRPSEMK